MHISPEENEQMIDWFLATYDDMELIPIEKEHGIQPGVTHWTNTHNEQIAHTARLWPHHLRGEGHFVAKCANEEKQNDGLEKQLLLTYRKRCGVIMKRL